ncbi:MAG: hypothetical protein WDO71_25710 [Bacteroidota bacterium]
MILFAFRKVKPVWLIVIGFVCIGIGMFKTQNWYGDMRDTRSNYVEAVAAEKAGKELPKNNRKLKQLA